MGRSESRDVSIYRKVERLSHKNYSDTHRIHSYTASAATEYLILVEVALRELSWVLTHYGLH